MSVEERFNAKAIRAEGCWGWAGSRDTHGYGQMLLNRRIQPAHRVSWTLFRGPIPSGAWVLHHCDNRECTNPEHLFLGDRRANIDDAVAKGRMRGHRKLTPEEVRTIRASDSRQADLARQYGVSPAAISMIVSRQRWSGITE